MVEHLKQVGTQTKFKVVILYKETLCVHVKFTYLETESSFCKFPVQQITFDIKEYKRKKEKSEFQMLLFNFADVGAGFWSKSVQIF